MLALGLSLLLLAVTADAPPASLVHARLQTHSAEGGVQATFATLARDAAPAWIGYAVPAVGRHQMCCFRSTDDVDMAKSGCRLENEGSFSISGDDAGAESAPDFVVLFRVEGGRVHRIRMLSRGCGIDAGGLPLHWITGVRAADSIALLESMVRSSPAALRQREEVRRAYLGH